MNKVHEIGLIKFAGDVLVIEIDGRREEYGLQKISPALSKASELERMIYEVSPSGYGIHWPLLDEDISVDSLLGITHHPATDRVKQAAG